MSTKNTASVDTTTRTASGPITSRRQFLAGSAAGFAALTVGFTLNGKVAAAAASELVPNPFVKVRADGTVVAILKHFEMGQGVSTGLTTLIAEEMDANWDTIEFEFAPADTATYKNLLFGAQGTGGSTAIANSWDQYRTAGAATRDLFVRAAAETWGVAPEGLRVASGVVSDGSGRSATFAELVDKASTLTPIENPKLKDASEYVLIGKETVRRKDSVSKTDGSAMFAIDMKVPGMLHAVVARPPRFGAAVARFDDTETRKVRGVVDVKAIPQGVVVYAKNTWAAIKGRSKLQVTWDESAAETRSSDAIIAEDRKELDAAGLNAANKGDAGVAITGAAKTVSAEFEFPFLAHAPMEPLNCIISFDGKTAELWDGCQFPTAVQGSVAAVLGIQPGDVKVNTMFAGGSFGRRTTPSSDYHSEAAQAVKAIDGKHPVKLVWTREDDLHGGYYRPAYVQRVEAGVDADGKAAGWRHRLAGKSILIGTFFENMLVKDGIDKTSVEGANDL
ncbi:MAG: molybdopterin cofactor-binding domain-containing protein, partial [Pseudomonadota bacterium]